MSRTCVLVIDNALQTAIPDLLVQWERDRTLEGWKVLPRLLSPADPSALKNLLSDHPADHVFLAGDSLPYQMEKANPDGHGSRPLPMDGMLTSGAVGRLNFKLQSNLNTYFHLSSGPMYREYFQRRHAWSQGRWILYNASLCPLIDYFATQYPFIGESYRQSIPTRIYAYENKDPASAREGGIWAKWHTTAPMTAITSSGGMDPGWLWNCGHTYDWFQKAIAVPIAFFFGSHMLEIHQDNSIMMGALASKHTLATFHPYLFTHRVGAKFSGLFDGSKTVGDLGRDFRIASASQYGFVGGDPTLALPTPSQMAQAQNDPERRAAAPKASSPPASALPADPKNGKAAAGNHAVFLASDTATRGNWKGKYGAEGYDIIGDRTRNPAYCSLSYSGQTLWNWGTQPKPIDPNTHPECLQKASGAGRIAVCYYTRSSMTIDLNPPTSKPHKFSLYMVDLLSVGRVQEIHIQDFTTGTVLDQRIVSGFGKGIYYSWNLSGHVRVVLTFKSSPGPQTAVISGLFFDPTSS